MYSREAMGSAIEVRTGGNSVRDVVRKYGICSITLHDHFSEKYTKVGAGGLTVLTNTDKREIFLSLIALREIRFE